MKKENNDEILSDAIKDSKIEIYEKNEYKSYVEDLEDTLDKITAGINTKNNNSTEAVINTNNTQTSKGVTISASKNYSLNNLCNAYNAYNTYYTTYTNEWNGVHSNSTQVFENGIIICEELSKEEYGFTKMDNLGIYSDIEKDINFLILAKALKDLLIKENIITQEKFDEMYNIIKNNRDEIINANKVADKLSKEENFKKNKWFYN